MKCENCASEHAKRRIVSRSYGRGQSLMVIENVPVISCPDCGESYLSAETLHAIDVVMRDRDEAAEERAVPVATLPEVGQAV